MTLGQILPLNLYDEDNVQDAIEIVSGGARGPDTWAQQFAEEFGWKFTLFKADWGKYSKAAGMIRNKQMCDYGDLLVAFWDGGSPGTRNMINLWMTTDKWMKVIKRT